MNQNIHLRSKDSSLSKYNHNINNPNPTIIASKAHIPRIITNRTLNYLHKVDSNFSRHICSYVSLPDHIIYN